MNDKPNAASRALSDQVVMVTGAGSGIGRAIAGAMSRAGARVAAIDIDARAAQSTADELDEAIGVRIDITDPDSARQGLDAVLAEWGRVDVLVNCAGLTKLAPALEISMADWHTTVDTNLSGTFLMCRVVGPTLVEQERGRIINIASQAASVAIGDHVAYCASKAGIVGMTKVLALEWGPSGVTVNTVSPTVVLTPLSRVFWVGDRAENMIQEIPTRRFAEPEEVADCCVFLASEGAAMINGHDLIVDGGYTIH